MIIRIKYLTAAIGISSLLWVPTAFANSCDNLNTNATWKSTFEKLNENYKNGDWDTALDYSKMLESICDESPILNYTIAHIHKNRGDKEKYLFYLQKSTQNTERFSVDKDTLDRMWSEKYIATHPEADPETIQQRDATIQSQSDEIALLKEELKTVQQTANNNMTLQDDAWLWTSVGIAAAGLVLTGVGAYFVAANHDKSVGADGKGYYTKKEYTIGWGLLGAGISMTVVSAAAIGFFGYRYKINHQNHPANELSFGLTPNYSSFTLTF